MASPHPGPLGDPYGRLLDNIAGRAATYGCLIDDPDSPLSAVAGALMETAKDVEPLLAAARRVLEVAAEFDAEDGREATTAGLRSPQTRGDRVGRAFVVGMIGEDRLAAVFERPS